MGRPKETSQKKEFQKKKDQNRKEKEKKRLERRENRRDGNSLDDMIAYVDQFGNITSTPPDLTHKEKVNLEDIEISVPKNRLSYAEKSIRKGIVSFFNESKGYGFIKDMDSQESFFVHANGLTEPIKDNNRVLFELAKGPKGMNAVNVKIDR